VKEACDASMEKAMKGGSGRRPVPWWNDEIGSARRDCLAARRRCQRSRGRGNQELRETTYRAKRKVLKKAIKASSASSTKYIDIYLYTISTNHRSVNWPLHRQGLHFVRKFIYVYINLFLIFPIGSMTSTPQVSHSAQVPQNLSTYIYT